MPPDRGRLGLALSPRTRPSAATSQGQAAVRHDENGCHQPVRPMAVRSLPVGSSAIRCWTSGPGGIYTAADARFHSIPAPNRSATVMPTGTCPRSPKTSPPERWTATLVPRTIASHDHDQPARVLINVSKGSTRRSTRWQVGCTQSWCRPGNP